jgi:hypothetical protein
MASTSKPDRPLKFTEVDVIFMDGNRVKARAEGNNAAWNCACGDTLPLVGRCYYQFGWTCYSDCPQCLRRYRVVPTPKKRVKEVREVKC